MDDTGNLEDSARLVFIDEECRNLIVVNDGVELTRKILTKRRNLSFTIAYRCLLLDITGESITSVTMGTFIVNQLGKHDFSGSFFTTE